MLTENQHENNGNTNFQKQMTSYIKQFVAAVVMIFSLVMLINIAFPDDVPVVTKKRKETGDVIIKKESAVNPNVTFDVPCYGYGDNNFDKKSDAYRVLENKRKGDVDLAKKKKSPRSMDDKGICELIGRKAPIAAFSALGGLGLAGAAGVLGTMEQAGYLEFAQDTHEDWDPHMIPGMSEIMQRKAEIKELSKNSYYDDLKAQVNSATITQAEMDDKIRARDAMLEYLAEYVEDYEIYYRYINENEDTWIMPDMMEKRNLIREYLENDGGGMSKSEIKDVQKWLEEAPQEIIEVRDSEGNMRWMAYDPNWHVANSDGSQLNQMDDFMFFWEPEFNSLYFYLIILGCVLMVCCTYIVCYKTCYRRGCGASVTH